MSAESVSEWRRNTKQKIIEGFGGECCICGYNRCARSLDVHHVKPEEKEFGISKIIGNPVSWERIVNELNKCVLVCSNCHGEIHSNMIELPDNAQRFDVALVKSFKLPTEKEPCVCGKARNTGNKYCSLSCAGKAAGKINWESLDLVDLLKYNSIKGLAIKLGCSDVAVHKRLKKLGLK